MKLNPFALIAAIREERAATVRPGSETERAWHALVPEHFRPVRASALPTFPTPAAPPAGGDTPPAANTETNPS